LRQTLGPWFLLTTSNNIPLSITRGLSPTTISHYYYVCSNEKAAGELNPRSQALYRSHRNGCINTAATTNSISSPSFSNRKWSRAQSISPRRHTCIGKSFYAETWRRRFAFELEQYDF